MEPLTAALVTVLSLCIVCQGVVSGGPPTPPAVDCTLDDDQTNPALDRCLAIGQKFAENYEKYLKKGKKMDVCEEYRAFGDCLRPMLHTCPSLNTTIHNKWKTILHQLDCNCMKPKASHCSVDLGCLKTEQTSIYMGLCHKLYDFNIKQGTHGKCRFLRERIDCEQSLVASACGEDTGDFYLAMVKARSKKDKCFVPHSYPQLKHFTYSDRCPQNLTRLFSECVDLHPPHTILGFMPANDLIVEGKRKSLKVSCKHFEKYNQCMRKLASQCDLGIDKLLQSNGQFRSYQLKMEYICSDVRQDYLQNMYCYQDVMKNGSFDKCGAAWEEVFHSLDNVTSYQFYCLPHHQATQALTGELETLRGCYQGVVEEACGHTGAITMANLIKLAFQDPHYLRFEFKADCTLHNTDPPAPSTRPPHSPSSPFSSPSSHHRRSHDTKHHRVTDTPQTPAPVAKASVTGAAATIRGAGWTSLLTWVLAAVLVRNLFQTYSIV